MKAGAGETSRERILGRVREANGGVGSLVEAEAEWIGLPRGYRRAAALDRAAMLDLLENRLRDYDANVVRCVAGERREAVGAMLRARGRSRIVAPHGIDRELLPEGFGFVADDPASPLSALAIDGFEGVLTEAALGIAETGTVVLRTVPGQGRRALSLVPDYHLCVLRADQVVATVPEAMELLAAGPQAFGMTFISGPSATADIEMTRIKGVHGPRLLDVLLVL